MDTRITIISGVLALLMVTSGMMLVNNGSNEDPVNPQEDADADIPGSQRSGRVDKNDVKNFIKNWD